MESTQADPRIGVVLNGRYRITEQLGEGGMGLVYRGERVQLGRPVAIKFLHSPYAHSGRFVQRFQREARAMSKLSHPHCVSVLDFGVHEAPYIVMDFVTGATLRHVLDQGRMRPQRALQIARQLLVGLAHAHGQGVIHRDIKPGNIMLGEATGLGDHVRIFDFGLAKLHDPELDGEPSMAAIVGTPAYMAPEQARADKVDARADLYAAGIVLFEMLTGQKPFQGSEAYEILCMQRDQPPPKLRSLAPELSVELEELVSKALEKDPDRRFQTATEFATALEAVPEWAAGTGGPGTERESDMAFARTQILQSSDLQLPSGVSHEAPRESATRVDTPPAPAPEPAAPAPAQEAQPAAPTAAEPTQKTVAARRTRRKSSGGGGLFLATLLLVGGAGYTWWRLQDEKRSAAAGEAVAAAKDAAAAASNMVRAIGEFAGPGVRDVSDKADPKRAQAPDEAEAPAAAAAEPEAEPGGDSGEGADLSDAVLAEADEALNDTVEREVVLPAATEPNPPKVQSMADVRALIAKGKTDQAIRAIQQLRRQNPRAPIMPFTLGTLYFDRGWWSDGLAKYRETIQLSAVYRKNVRIQRDAIRALGDDRTYARARALLVRDIGKAALPALRRAAQRDPSATVKKRAAAVAKQLAR